jgi:chemotaxis protein histidine kinase CheA
MAADTPDDFRKELVDLFVQEAHEWLQNMHVALDELQQNPAPERYAELIGAILAGVTNLGGSAATINLPDIEQASFETIPFIEALRDPQKRFSVQDFLSLCKQLGQIHTALTRTKGISFEEDVSVAAGEAICESLASGEFLQALLELQKKQPSSITSERNLISSLIEQIEGQVQAGVERIDTMVIQGYLAQVSEAEESFFKAINKRVPEIFKNISDLKMNGDEASLRVVVLEASLQDVAQLRTAAQQVNAGSATMFFTGLHSLLTMVAQRRVYLAATRAESVAARLHAMGEAIREWVEHGRAQRAAINQLLPAGHS